MTVGRRRRAGGVVVVAVCAALLAACTGPSGGRRRAPVEPTTTLAAPPVGGLGQPIPLQPLVQPAAPAQPCGPFPPPTAAAVAVGASGQVRWEVALEGGTYGNTAPILDATTAYATHAGQVVAIDLATGEHRWRADVGRDVRQLLLDGDTVIASLWSLHDGGGLVALATADGSPRWTWDAPPGGQYAPAGGLSGDPILAPGVGLVVGTLAGPLVALDPLNGLPRWSVGGAERPRYVVGGGIVVRSDESGMRGLDGRTGVTQWEVPVSDARAEPRLSGDTVVVEVGAGTSMFRAYGIGDGTLRWEHPFGVRVDGSRVTDEGVLVRTGTIRREWILLDPRSGEERWRSEVTGQLQGEPLVMGGYLVTLEDPGDSRTQVAARRLADGIVDWGVVFDGYAGSMVARPGGGVLVGGSAPGHGEGQMTAVRDGGVLWSARVANSVAGAPAPLPGGGAVVHIVSPLHGCASGG